MARRPQLTSVVDDFGAQDGGHLQHSDEGLVHGGKGERGHAVSPGHLCDVHCTVTCKDGDPRNKPFFFT